MEETNQVDILLSKKEIKMESRYSHSLLKISPIFAVSFFFTVLFHSPWGAFADRSLQDYLKGAAEPPCSFSSIVEYDATNARFVGRVSIDGSNYLASIASDRGKTKILCELTTFSGWVRGGSAFDKDNQRFFFIAISKGKPRLSIIDITKGRLVKTLALSRYVKNIEFDPSTDSLYGISHADVEKFVSIDLGAGEINVLSELPFVKGTGVGAMLEGAYFYFVGLWGGEKYLCAVDTKTKKMKKVMAESIGVDEYKVKSFKKNKDLQALFSHGVQTCTAIAGYDSESGVGFIAHFKPGYNQIRNAFIEIEEMIRKNGNHRGMKSMKLAVVGGVRGHPTSVRTLKTVYTHLVDHNGIEYDDITKFNTGISHTVVILNGEIKIF